MPGSVRASWSCAGRGTRAPGRHSASRAGVEIRVREVLRLDQDLSGFYARAAGDPDSRGSRRAPDACSAAHRLRGRREDDLHHELRMERDGAMVNALVTNLGEPAMAGTPATHAFPTAAAMAGAPESFYRETVRAGYRGAYLIDLATPVARGELDLEALAGPARRAPRRGARGPAAGAPRGRPLRRRPHHDDDGPQPPADPRQLDAPDVRATPRPHEAGPRRDDPPAVRPYGDHAGLAFWLFVTRDWVD